MSGPANNPCSMVCYSGQCGGAGLGQAASCEKEGQRVSPCRKCSVRCASSAFSRLSFQRHTISRDLEDMEVQLIEAMDTCKEGGGRPPSGKK